MSKIFQNDPASYPATSVSESKAAFTLRHILSAELVKGQITVLDKIPNVDGDLEVTNSSQVPLGKIEVQVKALDKKDVLAPKYQCSREFLSYCELSILPVMLIVVDIEAEKAYWIYLDRTELDRLSRKIKKDTVSVNVPLGNVIAKNNSSYVDDWVKIIQDRQLILADYETQKVRVAALLKELETLKAFTKSSLVGETAPFFAEIHKFLDIYNGLLDNEFRTIKQIRYPNFWKIGLGFSEYEDDRLSYILYPIHLTTNDTQIKKIDNGAIELFETILSYNGVNGSNPIKNRSRQYALELIHKDVIRVLDNVPLLVLNSFIANEYLIALVDHFHLILGLEQGLLNYEIKKISDGLLKYIPLLVEELLAKKVIASQQINIDDLLSTVRDLKHLQLIKRVNERLAAGIYPRNRYELHSESFNLYYAQRLLYYLSEKGFSTITRQYEKVQRNSFVIGGGNPEIILKNIRTTYSNIPGCYDAYVRQFFPLLYEHIKFYSGFNVVIIIADFSKATLGRLPEETTFYFISNDESLNKLYVLDSIDAPPELASGTSAFDLFKTGLKYDGTDLRLVRLSGEMIRDISDTPVYNSISTLATERFTGYFNSMVAGEAKVYT